jgi:YHS domain-containing protein
MRFTILAIPVLLALAACDQKPAPSTNTMSAPPAMSADRVKDPICGMTIDKEKAAFKTTHDKATYYFCAEGCLKKFQADPAKYAAHCACAKTAKKCACGHCAPKGETCDCN